MNYNSSADLINCVASLASERVASITIIDNGSTNPQKQLLDSLTNNRLVNIVMAERNIGFGAGVNLGVSHLTLGRSDKIWILNPDTVVEPGTAERLSNALEVAKVGIVSPILTTGPDRSKIWYCGGELDVKRVVSKHARFGEPVEDIQLSGVSDTTFVTGAAPMVTAHAWTLLGGFREDLFLYWEDAELSYRAATADIILRVVNDARVWHKQGGSTSGGESRSPTYYYYMNRNRLRLAAEWGSLRSVCLGVGLAYTVRLLLGPLRESSDRWPSFEAGAAGFLAGLRGAFQTKHRDRTLGPVKL